MSRFYLFLVALLVACSNAKKSGTLENLDEKSVDIVIKKEVNVESARKKAIDIYKDIEIQNTDKGLQFEAKRRLADLELEHEDAVDLSIPNESAKDKVPSEEQKSDSNQSTSYQHAIKLYLDLLNSMHKDDDKSQILYQLSKAYENVGENIKALAMLDRLVKNYPDVQGLVEIQFRRGELNFLLQNFKAAQSAYSKVMEMGEFTKFYEKSVYKHGWSTFKIGNYDQALNSFLSLLDRKLFDPNQLRDSLPDQDGKSKNPNNGMSRGEMELLNDTFRVINLTLNYIGGVDALNAYFAKTGHRNYEDLVYEKLGDFYLLQERNSDAVETYLTYVKLNVGHFRAPLMMIKVIDIYEQTGFVKQLFEVKKEFVEWYQPSGKYWNKFSSKTQELIYARINKNMLDVARHYHANAQTGKNESDYQLASHWYLNFMRTFTTDKNLSLVNYLFAECLFELKRYPEAIQEYEKTAYEYRTFDKGAEAAYAALVAYREHEKNLTGAEKEKWKDMANESSLRFAKTFSSDRRAGDVIRAVMEEFYAQKKLDRAAQTARELLELKTTDSKEVRILAWTIIAHSMFDQGAYKKAEVAYNMALTFVDNDDERAKRELLDGLSATIYKFAELHRVQGRIDESIKQFSRIKTISPSSIIAMTAEFDIGATLIEAKQWQRAVNVFSKFKENYPNSELLEQATQNLILAYTQTGDKVKVANELKFLIGLKDDEEFKRQATLKMAELFRDAGDEESVYNTYKEYVKAFPKPVTEAMEIRKKLADGYFDNKDLKNHFYWLNQIVETGKKVEVESNRIRYLTAEASYLLTAVMYQEFHAVRLIEPLKSNLKKKKGKMKQVLLAYQETAKMGVAEFTTAATFQIGRIYSEFARELLESERPKGLSTEELEQYELLLEDQAFPFEEKAIKIHETNVNHVVQGVYNEWIKKSFTELSTLNPVRYAKNEKAELVFDAVY